MVEVSPFKISTIARRETRLWTINFFMGTCTLYASRVALPICAAVMAQEYGWNKTDSVSCLKPIYVLGNDHVLFLLGLHDHADSGRNCCRQTWRREGFECHYSVVVFVDFVHTSIVRLCLLDQLTFNVSFNYQSCDWNWPRSVVAGGFGSVLLDWFGWRSLLSVLWWAFFKWMSENSTRGRLTPLEKKVKSKNSEECLLPVESLKRKTDNSVPWATLFSHPSFWAASIAQYCGANAYFTMFSWLPSYFSDNFPSAKGIIYNVVPYLAIVVTSLGAPFIASRLLTNGKSVTFTRRVMEGCSLTLTAICLLAAALSSSFYCSLIVFTLAMASRGLHHGGVSVNPHDFAPNHTGSVFGIFNAFSAVTGFIGVYVAGWILQVSGNNWSYVFVITSLQCIFGAIVYSLLGTGNKII